MSGRLICRFVYEVLQCSCTSTSLLQTAWYCMEAARSRVPALIWPSGDCYYYYVRWPVQRHGRSFPSDDPPSIQVHLREPLTAPPPEMFHVIDVSESLAPRPTSSLTASKQASIDTSSPPCPYLVAFMPSRVTACSWPALSSSPSFCTTASFSNKARRRWLAFFMRLVAANVSLEKLSHGGSGLVRYL